MKERQNEMRKVVTETHHCMASQVVHPALLSQLSHDSIYPGVAGASLLPGPVELLIVVPFDLQVFLQAQQLTEVDFA